MKNFAQFNVKAQPPTTEYVMQLLSGLNISGFEVTAAGFEFYIDETDPDYNATVNLLANLQNEGVLKFDQSRLADKNWNELWEKNFDPILIANQVYIYAAFHPVLPCAHTILINPKMAFGTGHHATTRLMIELQLQTAHAGKTVADCGCGTGVLGILALQKGAKSLVACDISEWAVLNTQENFEQNNCSNYTTLQATAADLLAQNYTFDIILANIQRNVILAEMGIYKKLLHKNGKLLVSGILDEASQEIRQEAVKNGFSQLTHLQSEGWNAWLFEKK